MALTPGSRQAAGLAAGWVFLAGCTGLTLAFLTEIRATAQGFLGTPDTAVVAVEGAGQDGAPVALGGRTVELKAGAYGHFHVAAEVNGAPVQVMVDTGASMVALRFEDARGAGIQVRDSDFTHRVSTANGFALMAPVMIERISIGHIEVRNVAGAVLEPGKLSTTLLGMSFLSRLQRVDIRSGRLVLQE